MKSHHLIKEGFTLDYLIHSIFLGVVGIVLCYFILPIGILLLAIAVVLISLQSGIEIDTNQKQIRVYHSFASVKKGYWFSLKGFDAALLKLERERTVGNEMAPPLPGSVSMGPRIQVKSFELVFVNQAGEEVSYHEFIDYKKAHKVCLILKKELGMQITDEFGEVHKKSLERRKRRR